MGKVTGAYFANLAQIRLVEQFTELHNDLGELTAISQAMDNRGLTNGVSVDELKSKQQLVAGQLALAKKESDCNAKCATLSI